VPCLAICQAQNAALQIDVLPFEFEYLVPPSAREYQQPDGSSRERVYEGAAVLVTPATVSRNRSLCGLPRYSDCLAFPQRGSDAPSSPRVR
jgi:hypothetical protein